MTAEWVQAIAGVATMIAAIAALIVASKAPRLAARWAEQYRRETADAETKRQMQMQAFMALMKCRAELLNQDARAAINLVDVIFADVPDVRSSRRLFYEAAHSEPFNAQTMVERYFQLTEAVGRAVGLGDLINGFDIRQGYYPTGLAKIDEAALLDAEAKLAKAATRKPKPILPKV